MSVVEVERKEMLMARTVVGASEAAAVLGIDPYQDRAGVYDRIVALNDHGEIVSDVDETNAHIERGNDLEPVVAERVQRQYGLRLMNQSSADVAPDFEYLRSNPDRVVVGRQELCEIKCPSPRNFQHIVEHGMPASWSVQGQAQLSCRPRMRAVRYAVHNVDPWQTLLLPPIERNSEYIAEVLRPAVASFYEEHVGPRIRPESPHPSFEPPLGWDGEVMDLGGDTEWLVAIREEPVIAKLVSQGIEDLLAGDEGAGLLIATEIRRQAGELYDTARKRVMEIMVDREAQVACSPGFKLTWKWQAGRKGLDRKALAAHLMQNCHGMRLEEFEYPGKSFRSFRPNAKY